MKSDTKSLVFGLFSVLIVSGSTFATENSHRKQRKLASEGQKTALPLPLKTAEKSTQKDQVVEQQSDYFLDEEFDSENEMQTYSPEPDQLNITGDSALGLLRGGIEQTEPKENPFDSFQYQEEPTEEIYCGPVPEHAELFVQMVSDPQSYLQAVSAPTIPLLIYGARGTGKRTLAHHIASEAGLKTYELEFDSEWQYDPEEKISPYLEMFLKLMEFVSGELDQDIDSKITVIITGLNPYFPLTSIMKERAFKDYLDRVFFITTLDTDDQSGDSIEGINAVNTILKTEVKFPDMATRRKVFEKLLSKRRHELSRQDISWVISKTRWFNGDDFNRLLELSFGNMLLRTKSPKGAIKKEHLEQAFADRHFEKSQNPSYLNMYL